MWYTKTNRNYLFCAIGVYMNILAKLSNEELEFRLKDLVSKERKLLHVILEHIKEVDTRKLYLQRAYPSIYEYLVKELGYSGSAAMRRLEAARLLNEVPLVSMKIQEGSLNLSQIGELTRMVKEKERSCEGKISVEQKSNLILQIAGQSTAQTQKTISAYLNLPILEREHFKTQKDDSVRVEITLSQSQYSKLMQCKDLAAHLLHQENKDSSLSSLIEVLADQFLKKKLDPDSKIKLTKQSIPSITSDSYADTHNNLHKIENSSTTSDSSPISFTCDSSVTTAAETECVAKSVTPKLRRMILLRDICCQYVDKTTGRKCAGTYGLQVDHKKPRWSGGGNQKHNLQALCFKHNQFKYLQQSGIRKL